MWENLKIKLNNDNITKCQIITQTIIWNVM